MLLWSLSWRWGICKSTRLILNFLTSWLIDWMRFWGRWLRARRPTLVLVAIRGRGQHSRYHLIISTASPFNTLITRSPKSRMTNRVLVLQSVSQSRNPNTIFVSTQPQAPTTLNSARLQFKTKCTMPSKEGLLHRAARCWENDKWRKESIIEI